MNRPILQRENSISQVRESITDGHPTYSPTLPGEHFRIPRVPDLFMEIKNEPVVGPTQPMIFVPVIGKILF